MFSRQDKAFNEMKSFLNLATFKFSFSQLKKKHCRKLDIILPVECSFQRNLCSVGTCLKSQTVLTDNVIMLLLIDFSALQATFSRRETLTLTKRCFKFQSQTVSCDLHIDSSIYIIITTMNMRSILINIYNWRVHGNHWANENISTENLIYDSIKLYMYACIVQGILYVDKQSNMK